MALPPLRRPIRLALLCDAEIFRAGLRLVLEEPADLELAGEAKNQGEALELLRREPIDILVVDLDVAGGDGFEMLRTIRESAPAVKLVAVTRRDEPDLMAHALRQGALGVVAKKAPARSLLDAIRSVKQGVRWLDPNVRAYFDSRPIAESVEEPSSDAWLRLTPREQDVAQLVAKGLRYKEIAARLSISDHTVKNHMRHIFDKLDISSRVELALLEARRSRS